MNKYEIVKKILFDQDYRFEYFASKGMFHFMPDEKYLKKRFKAIFKRDLDINNPISFSEKLQWLKLYDRNPIYSSMVDKYAMKEYVSKVLGEGHVVPTIGLWDSIDRIDLLKLPFRFVLKCTQDSGGVVICKDRNDFNYDKAKKKLSKCLKNNFYWLGREWPYKNVKPRIIAEEYMEDKRDGESSLTDYKVHCFNGKPKIILVCENRFGHGGMSEDFFSEKWEHLDIHRYGKKWSAKRKNKPDLLDDMLSMAKKLSNNIPFIRVDFYIVDNRVYVGELTFYPASGLSPFIPEKWDYTFGSWLHLPNEKHNIN